MRQGPGERHRLDKLSLAGAYQLSYRNGEQGWRAAHFEVRLGTVMMPVPRQQSPWLREQGITMISMNVVEVREVIAPQGVEALR